MKNSRPTISGHSWLITTPDGDEYLWFSSSDEFVRPDGIPEDHDAEYEGAHKLYADMIKNAVIEKHDGLTIIKTYEPNPERLLAAVKFVLDRVFDYPTSKNTNAPRRR